MSSPGSTAPELLHRGEAVLVCLRAGGLDGELAVEALSTLTWYVLGGALYATARSTAGGAQRSRFEDVAAEEFGTLYQHRHYFAYDLSHEHFRRGMEHLIAGYAARAVGEQGG